MTPGHLHRGGRLSPRVLLALVALATFGGLVLRVYLTTRMQSPFMFYDELTGPAVAREIGGVDIRTFGAPANPLYGVLLSPAVVAGFEPNRFYDVALILNAVLAALLTPLLFAVSRRVLRTSSVVAAVGAIAGGLSAGTVGFSSMMIPEVLSTFMIPVAILAFDAYSANPESLRGQLLLGGTLTVTFAAHQRLLVLILAAMVSIAVMVWQNETTKAAALRTIALIVTGYLMVTLTAALLHERIYVMGSPEAGGPTQILARAWESPSLVVRSLVGTSFYLSAATAGMAIVGAVFIGLLNLSHDENRKVHRFVGLVLAGTLALSPLFVAGIMADSGFRVDAYTYGRYTEHLVPVLFVYACAGWEQVRVRLSGFGLAVAFIVAGGVLAGRVYSPGFWSGPNAQQNHIGLHWIRLFRGTIDLQELWIFLGAPVVVVAMLALSHRSRVPAFALCALLMAVSGTVFVTRWSSKASENVVPTALFGEELNSLGGDYSIRIPIGTVSPITAQQLEFWAPKVELVPFAGGDIPDTDAVLITADAEAPPGSVAVLTSPRGDLVLWDLG